MQNVKTSVKGNILHIEIDTTNPGYVSESGKSQVLATTSGFQAVEGLPAGMSLSLNFTKRIPKAPKAPKA
jgi:hypothetical protein